jgi:nucleoside-diphosphate-sugar epimerase
MTALEPRIRAFAPDVVIHCAWEGGNNYASTKSSNQFHKNIPAIGELMEIIKRCGSPHFIGIGSAAEYGMQNCVTEMVREYPTSFYGTCKYMAKLYTQRFCETENVPWTWLRPFYTYGPDDVPTRLIPKTMITCLKKEQVLLDECKSVVDYLYIDDFISAVDVIATQRKMGIFNVCSNQIYNIRDIVEKIAEMTDNKEKLVFGFSPERADYPSVISGINMKLIDCTGWRPKVNIDEGLVKTMEFYKNYE